MSRTALNARSRARLSNAVVRKLEAGNGGVKGMRLLVPIEDEALVPVVVIGIAFGRYTSDGVAVLVKPIGGSGTLSVSATELLDDTPKARAEYAAKSAAAEYARHNIPKESASDKTWRAAVMHERGAMTEAQRKRFDATAPKRFQEGVEMVEGIKSATQWELKDVLKDAITIRFDADAGTLEYEEH